MDTRGQKQLTAQQTGLLLLPLRSRLAQPVQPAQHLQHINHF